MAGTWVEYARSIHGPARNARRALAALRHSLDLCLSSAAVTRTAVDDAVTWISITCDNAKLPEELIAAYQAFGPRLAALPPCGKCGDLTRGCLGGHACIKADLASHAAWVPFYSDPGAGEDENPGSLRGGRAQCCRCSQAKETSPHTSVLAPGSEAGWWHGGGPRTRSPSGMT